MWEFELWPSPVLSLVQCTMCRYACTSCGTRVRPSALEYSRAPWHVHWSNLTEFLPRVLSQNLLFGPDLTRHVDSLALIRVKVVVQLHRHGSTNLKYSATRKQEPMRRRLFIAEFWPRSWRQACENPGYFSLSSFRKAMTSTVKYHFMCTALQCTTTHFST